MYSSDIFTALNAPAVTSVIGVYNSVPALFSALTIPSDCEAKKTINFYQYGFADMRLEYGLARYTVNCRAETQGEALSIAQAVVTEINRKSYGSYYLFCQVGQPVPPADETDVFNCPIDVTIKKR